MTRTRSFAGDPNADLRTDKQKKKDKRYAAALKKHGLAKKKFEKKDGGPNAATLQKRALAKAKLRAAVKTVAKTVATRGANLGAAAGKTVAKRIAKSRKKK